MTRSAHACAVMAAGCPVPLAGFTVRQELRSWLVRLQAGPFGLAVPGRLDVLTVHRLPDGGGEGTEMSARDILAE